MGKLIVSNSSIVSDRTSDYISFHAVFAEGGETYFTGCDFKFDSGSSFSIDESKLYLKDCNFNTDSLGLAQDSVIYCSYQWMLKLDDKSRNIFNEYHYNGDMAYKNHTYNSKNPFIITIKNPYYFSEVKDYLTILDPSVMIMNILCDCVIYLEEYSSLQHVVIGGNGHNVLFKPCKIAETLQVSIYNLTFENYNFTGLFENEGALKFNNCSFMHNSFKDPASSDLAKNCFIYNRGSCVFENCTFGNNDVKTLIVNEGLLTISNSSFWSNSVQGVSDSKKWLFNNTGGVVFIFNSNFTDNEYDLTLHNYNSGDILISNCSGFSQKFEFSHPKKVKQDKIINKWLFAGLAVLSFAIGIASGGVGLVLSGSMVAAIITGGIFACGAAAGLAYADHVATGSDFLTCIRVFVPLALAGAIVGAVGGAFLDPAYVWPDPAEEVVNLIYEDSSSVSSMSSTELSEFLRSDTGIEFLFG